MAHTFFIIGDVHGCYHTFRALVETYWNPEIMHLIQLGDLTDRGKFVPETIAFARDLERQHPEKATFLLGNHEAMVLEIWRTLQGNPLETSHSLSSSAATFQQYFGKRAYLARCAEDMRWLEQRPLYWENEHILVSHAGISAEWTTREECLRFGVEHPESIVWTRSTLRNVGKVQVIGHTPIETGEPEFRPSENCWNIDTGAVFGLQLTALHLASDGTHLATFAMPTVRSDYRN
jgi:serine/threonine protein phosphatase 1